MLRKHQGPSSKKEELIRMNRFADACPSGITTLRLSPGESIGTFALESAMNELSYKIGTDQSSCASATMRKRIPPKVYHSPQGTLKRYIVSAPKKFG